MSKDFTFTATLTDVEIGKATRQSHMAAVLANTNELAQRLEGIGSFGEFLPVAGSFAVTRDGSSRVTTITYKDGADATTATVTISYDDGNGGRVAYIQIVIADPVAATIRETFSYDVNNLVTGSARTVS